MIFLQILKIIGIILLVILGLIILLLLIVLFDPIFYRLKGSVDNNKPEGELNVHWIFNLIQAKATYVDGKAVIFYRIAFKKNHIAGGPAKESKPKKEKKKKVKTDISDSELDKWEEIGSLADESLEEEAVSAEEAAPAEGIHEDEFVEEHDEVKTSKIKQFSDKIKSKINGLKDKYNKFKKTFKKYKRILTDQRNHEAVKHLLRELVCLIKAILPRRFKLSGSYSLGSPDTTAYVIGLLSMFSFSHHKDFVLYPDFETEDKYFSGDMDIKGRIYLYKIVLILIRVVLDKNCRRLYKMINK